MPMFLMVIAVCLFTVGGFLMLSGFLSRYDGRARVTIGLISGILGVVCIGIIFGAGKYWAGQGDAPEFAKAWVEKWHPGGTVECQAIDSDGNGYDSCTVGYTENGEHKVDAIECGVNRWYDGYHVTGCRLMKGYSGSQ